MEEIKPTKKWIDTVQMLANDIPQELIAKKLKISQRTVEYRVKRIREIWGIRSVVGVCVLFLKNGWVK